MLIYEFDVNVYILSLNNVELKWMKDDILENYGLYWFREVLLRWRNSLIVHSLGCVESFPLDVIKSATFRVWLLYQLWKIEKSQ